MYARDCCKLLLQKSSKSVSPKGLADLLYTQFDQNDIVKARGDIILGRIYNGCSVSYKKSKKKQAKS